MRRAKSMRMMLVLVVLLTGVLGFDGIGAGGTEQGAAAKSGDSLYKRLGGYDAIAAVVDDFVPKLVTDPQTAKFFTGHGNDSKNKIRQLAIDLVCMATGGPCVYIGRDMKTAHAGLGITEADWNVTTNHFVATLDKFKVPQKEKDELVAIVNGLKKDIVEKPAP